jgi:hypothetical protein
MQTSALSHTRNESYCSRCALYTIDTYERTQDKKTMASRRTSPRDGKAAGPSNLFSAIRRHASEPAAKDGTTTVTCGRRTTEYEKLCSHIVLSLPIEESISANQGSGETRVMDNGLDVLRDSRMRYFNHIGNRKRRMATLMSRFFCSLVAPLC